MLVGDSGVGKSCLMLRSAADMCSVSHIVSVALDFRIRTTHVDDTTIKLQIWNTAGQERFKTITSSDFDGVHGIIIVYDITNPATFENVERIWLREIECFVGDEVSKLLAGNKCDLEMERQVSFEAGKLCADLAGIPFLETSAKDATKYRAMFIDPGREHQE